MDLANESAVRPELEVLGRHGVRGPDTCSNQSRLDHERRQQVIEESTGKPKLTGQKHHGCQRRVEKTHDANRHMTHGGGHIQEAVGHLLTRQHLFGNPFPVVTVYPGFGREHRNPNTSAECSAHFPKPTETN